jgi:hypothetical protein
VSMTSCVGAGADFDLEFSISGIDWVATTVASTGRPSVASMSIQGGAYDPVDDAVTNVTHSSSISKASTNVWNSWLIPAFPLPSQVGGYSE